MASIITQASNPRKIKYIVVHTTAGNQDQSIADIQAFWKRPKSQGGLGWKSPGYHFLIKPDGLYEQLASLDKQTNGVAGYNANAIHLSYIGGIDKAGKAVDNRTDQQKKTMIWLIKELKKAYPNAVVLGHRDFSTDKNGNGIIEQWEYIKWCPCFDVRTWLQTISLSDQVRPIGIVYKLNYPLVRDEKVKIIQAALNKAGAHPVLPVTGNFATMTDKAVKDFQKCVGLEPTGIVDTVTMQRLGIAI